MWKRLVDESPVCYGTAAAALVDCFVVAVAAAGAAAAYRLSSSLFVLLQVLVGALMFAVVL